MRTSSVAAAALLLITPVFAQFDLEGAAATTAVSAESAAPFPSVAAGRLNKANSQTTSANQPSTTGATTGVSTTNIAISKSGGITQSAQPSSANSAAASSGGNSQPIATISASGATITGGGQAAPSLTSGLPSIVGAYHYITPSVPVTAGAPYLQKSKAPEGTFFIATGAVLGLLGIGVILWRTIVACTLHRSVRRAQEQQNMQDAKALIGPPGGGFYGQHPYAAPSTHSFEQLVRSGREKNTAAASRNSLFYSPTGAGMTANNSQHALTPTTFLPSGYYPANAQQAYNMPYAAQSNPMFAMPANTPTQTSFAGARTSYIAPQYSPMPVSASTQASGQGQRAPSAFLDELLDHQAPRTAGSGAYRG